MLKWFNVLRIPSTSFWMKATIVCFSSMEFYSFKGLYFKIRNSFTWEKYYGYLILYPLQEWPRYLKTQDKLSQIVDKYYKVSWTSHVIAVSQWINSCFWTGSSIPPCKLSATLFSIRIWRLNHTSTICVIYVKQLPVVPQPSGTESLWPSC